MFKILLQKEDLEGLAINETIKTVVAEQIKEQSFLKVYKPRSGKINNKFHLVLKPTTAWTNEVKKNCTLWKVLEILAGRKIQISPDGYLNIEDLIVSGLLVDLS